LTPLAVLMAVVIFATGFAITRMVSVGSLAAAAALPLLIWLRGYPLPSIILGICVGALVIYRHKENIQRLLLGKENKLWGKS